MIRQWGTPASFRRCCPNINCRYDDDGNIIYPHLCSCICHCEEDDDE